MKLRYVVHAVRLGTWPPGDNPQYKNVGVWVQAGKRLYIEYLPGYPEEAAGGKKTVDDLDGNARPDLLDYFSDTVSIYRGSVTRPVETDRYMTPEAALQDLMDRLRRGAPLPET
jgi:hypothetical protein